MSAQKLLVGFDGSPSSVDAARWARSLADALDWGLVVATVPTDLGSKLGADADADAGLLGHAEETASDLVVVGAHGLGGITGARLGGTAMAVLHRSHRPVALVPPPA